MTRRPLTRTAALGAAVVALGSCGDATGPGEPDVPSPGELRVHLASPAGRDGAVLLTITGPAAPTEVTGTQAGVLVHARAVGGGWTVALFGAVSAGEVLRVRVPDVRKAAAYHATVREVAGEDNALRENLGAYRLTITADGR